MSLMLESKAIKFLDNNFACPKSPKHPHGRHCTFVQIDEKIAVKVYENRKRAETAYENQDKAHKIGAGPQVYGFFKYKEYWCVITQVANMPAQWYRDFCKWECDNEDFGEIEDFLDWIDTFDQKEIKELSHKLQSVGFDFCDQQPFNYGEIDGRLVCIDFAE